MKVNHIHQGNALEILKTFPDNSIDCCVTSPPYWGLRDYGHTSQLGLEPTFQEYISKLCDIFDEVKRVLIDTGTCWVVLGDTYSGSMGAGYTPTKWKALYDGNSLRKKAQRIDSLPNKSLCQTPSRFAIEMSDRGWILRNEIIWHKPSCMPSSVKDRFTVDFEKVFFFVKNQRYWFEQQLEPTVTRGQSVRDRDNTKLNNTPGRAVMRGLKVNNYEQKNKRTVWSVSPQPYKEAHFATYPPKLIEPMIKAGCPVGGVVLDPFIGSGATALVALEQNKHFVGIELNPEYIELAYKRIADAQPTLPLNQEVKS